jgi:hypothetical protein
MRIVLHIGPHKTGTTALQRYLADTIGRRKPRRPDWYPLVQGRSQNAAVLQALAGKTEAISDIAAQAESAGVQRLFLSAEAFCTAYPDRIPAIAESLRGYPLILVSTLSSPLRRAASMWQERVKHKFKQTLEQAPDAVLDHPGFQPDLLSVWLRELEPESTAIFINSASDSSECLLQRFATAFGLPQPTPAHGERRNASLGYVETEAWRYLNVLMKHYAPDMMAGQQYEVLRQILWDAFTSAEWQDVCPRVRIPIPAELRDNLQNVAAQMREALIALAERSGVTLHGDPAALLEDEGVVLLDPAEREAIYAKLCRGASVDSGPPASQE